MTRPTTIAAGSNRSSTGGNGPEPSRLTPDRARGERPLLGVDLVAALRQLGEPERALRVGAGLDLAADRLAAQPDDRVRRRDRRRR